jgi:5-formyltetrahydrofolate cyclo-ligase
VQQAKQQLRTQMRKLLQTLPRDKFMASGQAACEQLVQLPTFVRSSSVAIFFSMEKEIWTRPIIRQVLKHGVCMFEFLSLLMSFCVFSVESI